MTRNATASAPEMTAWRIARAAYLDALEALVNSLSQPNTAGASDDCPLCEAMTARRSVLSDAVAAICSRPVRSPRDLADLLEVTFGENNCAPGESGADEIRDNITLLALFEGIRALAREYAAMARGLRWR
jgi:hypothetical protein